MTETTTTVGVSTVEASGLDIVFIDTLEMARTELAQLAAANAVSLDTETVILRDADGEIIPVNLDVDGPGPWRVMSLAARFGAGDTATYKVWVLDVATMNTGQLAPLFKGIRPFAWNAPFDDGVTARGGIKIRRWWDAMVFEAKLRQGTGPKTYISLAKAVRRFFGYEMGGKDDTRLSYDEHTPLTDEQIRYAGEDAFWTLKVGEKLSGLIRDAGLLDAIVREANSQPFIHSMTINGLPMNEGSYRRIVDNAVRKAAEAAERIAVATTGSEMLNTVVRWAVAAGRLPAVPTGDDLIETGLGLLHDEDTFGAFLAGLRDQVETTKANIGELLGVGGPQEDLFSDEPVVALPFDIDSDVDVRRWITSTMPHFATAYVVADRDGTVPREDLEGRAFTELREMAGTKFRLTKDHELADVLAALATSTAPDVTDDLRQVATQLTAYRRYQSIVTTYGATVGVVRLVPDWNVNAPETVKEMLNRFSTEAVHAFTGKTGTARLLGRTDSIDAKTLKLIGGPLPKALLDFREHEKIVTTYGDDLLGCIHPRTGRIHAKYTQALTGTGRLASFKPNAQNLSPRAKPHMGPAKNVAVDADGANVDYIWRVLVRVDQSQAELRYVADESQDVAMLEAFRSGEDLHQRTAQLMFGRDMKALKAQALADPGRCADCPASDEDLGDSTHTCAHTQALAAGAVYKELRHKAKAVAFGYAYGLRGASLALQLTVNGVPTSKEEADELLRKFDQAYPQVAAWMAARVAFITQLADAIKNGEESVAADYEASWVLHLTHTKAKAAARSLAQSLGRTPTGLEVSEKLYSDTDLATALGVVDSAEDDRVAAVAAERSRLAAQIEWALSYEQARVLRTDGLPWSFESRTRGGSRRLFDVDTNAWTMSMVKTFVRTRKDAARKVRDAWVESWNATLRSEHEANVEAGKRSKAPALLTLTKNGRVLDNKEIEKVFEKPEMRNAFVSYVLEQMPTAREFLFRSGLADQVRSKGNQYRNHPIQGGVADAMLLAFGRIDEDLVERFPTAGAIQSVHDSVVIECDVTDAAAVRDMVVGHMEQALAEFCPTVPCVADGDVALTLDDESKVSDDKLAELIDIASRLRTAPATQALPEVVAA